MVNNSYYNWLYLVANIVQVDMKVIPTGSSHSLLTNHVGMI